MTTADGQYLVDAGIIQQADLDKAVQQVGNNLEQLESAILARGVITPTELGKAMADHYKLPYADLAAADVALAKGQALSHVCCEHWGVVPLAFDNTGSILTLAVSSPASASAMQRVTQLLMRPYDVAFAIASQIEIEEWLGKCSEVAPVSPKSTLHLAKKAGGGSPRAESMDESSEKSKPSALNLKVANKKDKQKPVPATNAKPAETATELDPAHDLARPLINAVAMLVEARLVDEPDLHEKVCTRARYCQLLASRLQASALELTKAVLAAWISSIDERGDILSQLMLPFDVEEVVAQAHAVGEGLAACVLALVLSYETFAQESEGDTPDVTLVRRHLMSAWHGAREHQDMLEAFLQVLMDEQYLRPFDTAGGALMLVDPKALLATRVKRPLSRAGCSVSTVASASEAFDAIRDATPDVIIADARTCAKEILDLCKRTSDQYPDLKIIVITAPASEVRGAAFLRAGVADLVMSPLDLEVLFLTVEKNLTIRDATESGDQKGISGSLSDMSFNDMIQILSAGAKNLRIEVTKDSQRAEVYMRAGDIIHCELGERSGPEAFYSIMRWTDGTFAANQCREFPEPTISVSTMSLLMEGSRQLDEEGGGDI
jgi:DNA-binding response OmpR family regulator